jgi:hypothetical protein
VSGQFAKGCSLDKGKHRYTSFNVARMRGLVSQPVPSSIDLSAFQPPVMDQGPCGSCEGHSSAAATYTSFAKAGEKLPWVPSPGDIYKLARCVDRFDPNTALTDGGTETNSVLRAIAEFGIRPMGPLTSDGRYSDCEPSNVNLEPNLAQLEQDALTLIVSPYAITTSGDEKWNDYQAALANGFTVRVDSFVDTAFEQWQAGNQPFGVPNYADQNGGGHALYSAGYSAAGGDVTNSWGLQWGMSGHIIVSKAFILQCDVTVWKVSVAP